MAGRRAAGWTTLLAIVAALHSGCTAIVDPSCGPCQEVCRPIHCPPSYSRTSCLDGFSDETWYQCPLQWRHACGPLQPAGCGRQSLSGAAEVFQTPKRAE